MTTQTFNVESNKGILFPRKSGIVEGAVRIGEDYYETKNSSITQEEKGRTINVCFKKPRGRKAIDVHFTKTSFTGPKDPKLSTEIFLVNNVQYQMVGWIHKTRTGNDLLSIAVNEIDNVGFGF